MNIRVNNNQRSTGLGLKLFTGWLSLALVAQPLPLYAAGVIVDGGGAKLTEAANGVPVIDIAAPSAAGVSHNRFTQFNVDSHGLILNNSAVVTQSQLGGAVDANSHLQSGREASLILNEVTAANRSQLRGYTEIAGRSAEYILANPYGITCNGCGFINTPRVTLTTGVPQMYHGALQGLSVDGGDILIEGLGLNAANVDHFNIITRAARLNAEFYANDLDLILGRNDVNVTTGAITSKADSNDGKPQFALDASVLGAMYAGQINLIGTEAGVGVRIAGDMAADAGDIHLSADGNLSLARVRSNQDLLIESANGGIDLNGLSYAGGSTTLNAAGTVTINDLAAARGDIAIQSAALDQYGTLVAGLNSDYSINTEGELNIIAGTVSNQGATIAGNRLTIDADTLLNTDWLRASGEFNLSAGNLVNTGGLIEATALSIVADSLDNSGGELAADDALNLHVTGRIDNDSGLIDTGGLLDIDASHLSNIAGEISSAGFGDARIVVSADIDNTGGTLTINAQDFTLNAGGGLINREGSIAHIGAGLFTLQTDTVDNDGGVMASNGSLTATFNTLSNTLLNGQSATLLADHLTLNGSSIDNSGGSLYATGPNSLEITAAGLTNADGEVYSVGNAVFNLHTLDNNGGLLQSEQSLTLNLPSFDTDQIESVINAGTDLILNIDSDLVNAAGSQLLAHHNLEINTDGDIHNHGEISTGADFIFRGDNLTNYSHAILSAGGDFTLDIDGSLINQANARISSAANLDLTASLLENRGLIAAGENLITHTQSLDNYNTLFAGNDAELYVTGAFRNLTGANVFAMNNITIAANAALNRSGSILNQSAVMEAYNGDIGLYAGTVTNRREVYNINSTTGAELAGNTAPAQILAGDDIIINANTLLNDVSQIAANDDITLNANVTNRGRVYDTVLTNSDVRNIDGVSGTRSINGGGDTATITMDNFTIDDGPAFVTDVRQRINEGEFNNNIYFEYLEIIVDFNPNRLQPYIFRNRKTLILITKNGLKQSDQSLTFTGSSPITLGLSSSQLNTLLASSYSTISSSQLTDGVGPLKSYRFIEPDDILVGKFKPSTIEAGGALSIAGSLNNENSDVSNVGGSLGNPTNIVEQNENTGFNSRHLEAASVDEDLSAYVYNPAAGLVLPNNGGLFVTNSDPGHPYLIETNPDLLDLGFFDEDGGVDGGGNGGATGGSFLGTDVLLSQMPVPPEITSRRLGDAFYETRLVREAVFNVTGQRYANESIENDYQQMQYLMNNAIEAQQALNLTLGVALSADQVAQLTHDILWLVEQEIQGYKVLVPVYYASAARPGALLIADSVEVSADEGGVVNTGHIIGRERVRLAASDILNTGVISARDDLKLVSYEDLINRRGLIAGSGTGTVLLVARDNVLNDQGAIRGGNMELTAQTGTVRQHQGQIQAEQDLQVTVRQDLTLDSKAGTVQAGGDMSLTSNEGAIVIGDQRKNGERYQLSAGGDLDLNAAKNLDVYDSELTAGESLSLSGEDVNLHARRIESGYSDREGRDQSERRTVEHRVTELKAGDDIRIDARDDIVSEAATFNAGDDIALNAKDDIDLQAVHNEDYTFEQHTQKKSFGRKKTTVQEDYTITAQGTELKAGGDVHINVDENGAGLDSGSVTFEGSTIKASGDVLLSADDDIDVYAAKTYEFHRQETRKKGTLGLKNESKGDVRQLQGLESSTLKATDDLGVLSGNNITVVASTLEAGGDVSLTAYNDVLIGAGEVAEQSESWHEKSRMFDGGDLYSLEENREGTANVRAEGSTVQSGGNITLNAGRATVVGSTLAAGDSLSAVTDIGDIQVLAAKESSENYSHEKRITVSLGDAAKGMGDIGDAISTDDGRLKIKLADAQYDSVDSKTSALEHKSSELIANNSIRLDSVGDILIEGSHVIADANQDNSGDVSLTAGENVIIKEAEGSLSATREETHGSAELSFVVQHQAVEVVLAAKALDEAGDQLKQAKEDYRKYQKDRQKLEDELTTLEQAYKDKEPGVSYEDVLELRSLLEEVKDDEDWYTTGIALAAANVASKTTALVQQTAAAAQSAGTYGFNAGVQLDIDATTTRSESNQTTSLASTIAGQNIRIQTGTPGTVEETQTLIQGSHLQAADKIKIDTGELNIVASRDTTDSNTQTEHANISIQQTVYGAAGGPSVNASYDRSRDRNTQTTFNNSTLGAADIQLSSTGDTNIRGGNIDAAQALTVEVGGDLNVESMQNRSHSSANSAGISGGLSMGDGDDSSVSSANAGANSGNGRQRNTETVLSSLTSGGTADITVKNNTQITGAVIATIDQDGNDLGKLNLSTQTLSYTDLADTNYSSQKSAGISSSVGFSGSNPADPTQQRAQDATGDDKLRLNTTNIQYSNSSHYDKGKTLATLGQGAIIVTDEAGSGDLERLNRDTTAVNKDLYSVDRQEGNIDVTIDHRLLSEEGRKEIKEDFKRTELLGESIADIVTEESVGIQDTFQHIGDVQKDLDVQKLLATQNGGENAKILNDLANATPEQKQRAIGAYAQAYADVYGITIDQANVIAVNTFIGGAHYSENGQSSSIYINDNAQNNASDYMDTVGHEVAHAQIEQDQIRDRGELNEDYANLRGEYAAGNYGFSFANNGLGTVNAGITNNHIGNKTSELIAGNTSEFITTAQHNPDKIDYRPLERQETVVLNTLIDQVKKGPYTDEVKIQVIGNAMAEACARTHCAEGVPQTDANYQALQDLQASGEKLIEGGQNLLTTGGDGELFQYDRMDTIQDLLRANDEGITRVNGAAQAVLGTFGAAASMVEAVATSPACTTAVGCLLPAAGVAGTAISGKAAMEGMDRLMGQYQSSFGQEVLNNLLPDTYQDPSNPVGDLALNVGTEVALLGLGKVAEKAADGAEGLINSVKSNRNSDETITRAVDESAENWGTGPLRPPSPNATIRENEMVQIDASNGLQSSKSGTFQNVNSGNYGDPDSKYLWTVDGRGVNIALENTPVKGNPVIKHTNISSQASVGGEVWFGPNNTVTINAGSGRFGDGAGITQEQWDATIKLWESLGYKVNPIPFGKR